MRFALILPASLAALAMGCVAVAATQERLARLNVEETHLSAEQAHNMSQLARLLADISRAGRIPELAVAIGDAFLLPVARLLAEGRTDGSIDSSVDEEATSALIYGAVTVTGLHYLVAHESLDAGRVGDLVAGLLNRGLRAR